jgi:hypothetical protein
MTSIISVVGTASCWKGCGGTILVKKTADWMPKDKKREYAYCDRCGLVYAVGIIKARSDYKPTEAGTAAQEERCGECNDLVRLCECN